MFEHKSVLLDESIAALQIKPEGIYVDGTAGGGGHSYAIASRLTTGRLISIDRDPDAVNATAERLASFKNVMVVHDRFSNIKTILRQLQIEKIDGMLLDLGVSSYQLDTRERGFSYHGDAPLDMRMSKTGVTAAQLVNTLSAAELSHIFFTYADEKFAFKIADRIVQQRKEQPIETTAALYQIVANCYPAKFKRDGNPARKVFQALRIAVNGELEEVKQGIEDAFELLQIGGRIAVITFHSVEDRLVKQCFATFCRGCECPPDFPVCVCGKTPRAKLVFKKPIEASMAEQNENQRSRSAKLRAVERIK